jgi:hypothetical protein
VLIEPKEIHLIEHIVCKNSFTLETVFCSLTGPGLNLGPDYHAVGDR